MIVEIKNGRKLDIYIGDRVDITSEDKPVTILGIDSNEILYTYEGIDHRHRLGDYGCYRRDFGVPAKYGDNTFFLTCGTCRITGHHRPSREQERAAAWGQERHVAPAGAAFEFI